MFDYNLKRKIQKKDSILETEKYMYREDDEIRFENEDRPQVDYVRKPIADRGPVAIACGAISLIFTVVSFVLMKKAAGTPPKVTAAFGMCSIIWAIAAIGFGIAGLTEKDRNYTASFVSISVGAVIIVLWAVTVILGNR